MYLCNYWRDLIEYFFSKQCFLCFKNKLDSKWETLLEPLTSKLSSGISVLSSFDLNKTQPESTTQKIFFHSHHSSPLAMANKLKMYLKNIGLQSLFLKFFLSTSRFDRQQKSMHLVNFQVLIGLK